MTGSAMLLQFPIQISNIWQSSLNCGCICKVLMLTKLIFNVDVCTALKFSSKMLWIAVVDRC